MQSGLRRSRPLCALDEDIDEVVLVAKLKERHASVHRMQACMGAHEKEQVRKCQSLLSYGESEDPAKMTDSKMALIERGPSSRQPNAKLRT
jgi:hypothetical protein